MSEPATSWKSRFAESLSDAEMDARTAVVPKTLPDLGQMPVEAAKSLLDVALQGLFVPSVQTRAVLRELQALCCCYCAERYPDEVTFLRNLYASDAEHASYEPQLRVTCLTGLAGVGKSAVISAFGRLFPPQSVEVDGHGTFELKPAWRMSVKSGSSLRQLVAHLFRHPNSIGSRTIPFTAIQRELCAQGVASIQPDELQFLTQGQGNALPAKLLNSLARLGPPLVYVANYSLLHRLISRPQEEKHRLLAKPLFLTPDTPDSEDWRSLLRALSRVEPSLEELSADGVSRRLWGYTYGIRRLLARLLTGAYVAMRARGAHRITIVDLDCAYADPAYAASRTDVDLLVAGLEKSDRKKRKDLWCPLPAAPKVASTGAVVQHPAANEYKRRSADAALIASMTPAERQSGQIDERVNPSKAKRTRRHLVTLEELQESLAKYPDGVASGRDEGA
ncbi:MAG TPA: hypothetical protein VFK31_01815 [Rhodanobacteraceae bacterium]|nr:hypothetical protein [Rhodanobacteraceae bacterium]